MSITNIRVLAGTVAATVALLTGIVVGLLTIGYSSCETQDGSAAPSAASQPSPTESVAAGLDDSNMDDGKPLGPARQAQPRATTVAAQSKTTGDAATQRCTDVGFGGAPALAGVGGAGLAALSVSGFLMFGASRRRRVLPEPPASSGAGARGASTGSPAGAGGGADLARLEADRAALVNVCIYVRDRVTSKALADRLAAALREAGVASLEPVGAPFDSAYHEAGGAVPTDDPAKVGVIAAVEVPGYADRGGRVLRAPVVTVYQPGGRASGEGR